MLPFAHLSSGYLVYASVAQAVEVNNFPLLGAALAGAMAPDIDGLFGAQMKDHKDTVFHAPLFWAVLFAIIFIVSRQLFPAAVLYTVAFFTSILIHLLLDWVSARTTGIRIFYPFSKKIYSLFPPQPDKGNVPTLPDREHWNEWLEFWKFYFSRRFLVVIEFVVTVSPAVVYMVFKT